MYPIEIKREQKLVTSLFYRGLVSREYYHTMMDYLRGIDFRIEFGELYTFFFLVENCPGMNTGFNPYHLRRLYPSLVNLNSFNEYLHRLVKEGLLERKKTRVYVISESGQKLYSKLEKQNTMRLNKILKEIAPALLSSG